MSPILAKEGWFVSHLFLSIDRAAWRGAGGDEKARCREELRKLVGTYRGSGERQLFSYAIWGMKADVGFLLVDPDLDNLNRTEALIINVFPPGVASVAWSFVSMSEISEYLSQEEDFDRTLRTKFGLLPEQEEYQAKMEEFRRRMQVYIDERLYPVIPAHRVVCFYPMNKRRGEKDNWYLLDFEARKTFMASHAITGRKYQENVKQLVTGAVGLDDWEWGVTLFSDDPFYFKKIVYEMRYDEASARFGEFGHFLIGIQAEADSLLDRLGLGGPPWPAAGGPVQV